MATPLPEKVDLNGNMPEELAAADRSKYEARKLEESRRKNLAAEGVAQEALDCVEALLAEDRSPSEAFTVYGYSLAHVVKPALAEVERITSELRAKPSKDVQSDLGLDVAAIMTKHGIEEFVPPEPKPEVIE